MGWVASVVVIQLVSYVAGVCVCVCWCVCLSVLGLCVYVFSCVLNVGVRGCAIGCLVFAWVLLMCVVLDCGFVVCGFVGRRCFVVLIALFGCMRLCAVVL